VHVQKIEDELDMFRKIDYVLKDIAVHDNEIKNTLKSVQKCYGFYGASDINKEYKHLYNIKVEKLRIAQIKLESAQEEFRMTKILDNPTFKFLRSLLQPVLSQFRLHISNKLTEFLNHYTKYSLYKSKPEVWKLFSEGLVKNKEKIIEELPILFTNLFLIHYNRQLSAGVNVSQNSFHKQIMVLFLSFVSDEDEKKLNDLKMLLKNDDDFGTTLTDYVIITFNTLMQNKLKIEDCVSSESDAIENVNPVKPKHKRLKRYRFVIERNSYLEKEVKELISKDFIANRLPLIYEPKSWKFEISETKPLQNNYSGGYLLNNEKVFIPACDSWHSHKLLVKDSMLETCLNYVQSRPFRLNISMFNYLFYKDEKNNCELISDSLSKPLIVTEEEYNNALKSENDFLKDEPYVPVKYREAFSSKFHKIIGKYRDQQVVKNAIDSLQLALNSDKLKLTFIWFAYALDFRTRMVPLSHANPMSSKLCRSLLLHPTPLVFDEEIFKYNAIKLFEKTKYSFNEAVEKFNLEGFDAQMLNFRSVRSIYRDANEPFAMLAACFEWERYKNFCLNNSAEDYRSYYLMGVDATASGSQILSMIMNDGTYQEELNLAVSNLKAGIPDHYYTALAREYLDDQLKTNPEFAKYLLEKNFYKKYYELNKQLLKFNNLTAKELAEKEILIPVFKSLIMKGAYNQRKKEFLKDVKEVLMKFDYINMPKEAKDMAGYEPKHEFARPNFIYELGETAWNTKKKLTMTYYIAIMDKLTKALTRFGLEIKWLTRTGGYVFQSYNVIEKVRRWKDFPSQLHSKKRYGQEDSPFLPKIHEDHYSVAEKFKIAKNKRSRITFTKLSSKMDKSKMNTATPPSYFHSLDADIIFAFTYGMLDMPYISFFLVHDTVDFPHSYYFKMMKRLAMANHKIFVESRNEFGQSLFHLFINDLVTILAETSPAGLEASIKLREEIDELFKEAEKIKDGDFDYDALINSRVYY
jgi:hypothetical protein